MKKNLIAVTICLLIGIIASTQSFSQGTKVKAEQGTVVRVKSLADISSKDAKSGDLVDFVCAEDIFIGGKLIIKENASVFARIEEAEKAKSGGKQGSIKIAFEGIKAVDGQKIPLRSVKGTTEGKSTLASTVALSLVVSPLFLLKKGKEVNLPKGHLLEAYVAQDVEIVVQ
jgi:hypothetical protein